MAMTGDKAGPICGACKGTKTINGKVCPKCGGTGSGGVRTK